MTKAKALAKFLDCDLEDVSRNDYDSDCFEVSGERENFLVLTNDEANTRCREQIEQSFWAFNTGFILSHTDLPLEAEKMIQSFQKEKCEDANDTIRALIKDFDHFVNDAISADGRGHFISGYDGEENEAELDGEMFFIYRQ